MATHSYLLAWEIPWSEELAGCIQSTGKKVSDMTQQLNHHISSESESEVAQSCLTLCDPVDCSPPGSSIHGIFQARVLKWVAISFFIFLVVTFKIIRLPLLRVIQVQNEQWQRETHNYHFTDHRPSGLKTLKKTLCNDRGSNSPLNGSKIQTFSHLQIQFSEKTETKIFSKIKFKSLFIYMKSHQLADPDSTGVYDWQYKWILGL